MYERFTIKNSSDKQTLSDEETLLNFMNNCYKDAS